MKLLSNGDPWRIHHGDCITHMADMPEHSVDMAVMSVPFPSVYAYTDQECDIGNSEELRHEAKLHFGFFFKQIVRVVKPGRVIAIHVQQIPRMKRTGEVGLHDFRGLLSRIGERAGLVYEYDWLVRKNPQAQAIRTRSRELQFAGLESDRAKSRGTLGDYVLKFRVPGENAVAINALNEVSRNDWIKWAEACWDDVQETDTLNTAAAKSESDLRHICPLQLEVIRRLILLYSNPARSCSARLPASAPRGLYGSWRQVAEDRETHPQSTSVLRLRNQSRIRRGSREEHAEGSGDVERGRAWIIRHGSSLAAPRCGRTVTDGVER